MRQGTKRQGAKVLGYQTPSFPRSRTPRPRSKRTLLGRGPASGEESAQQEYIIDEADSLKEKRQELVEAAQAEVDMLNATFDTPTTLRDLLGTLGECPGTPTQHATK